ncbi:hypothetical protein [Paramagnetospirillum marisnigri]|uniref:hypothetical protein n=1 Tax=Paramagnetospirillum marisnigri TaxID=1285242 RepID=UPI0012E6F65B|nr:hypothetical protein [Paramagnetospirillum marisnigri]
METTRAALDPVFRFIDNLARQLGKNIPQNHPLKSGIIDNHHALPHAHPLE